MLRLCINNHIGGYRKCRWCGLPAEKFPDGHTVQHRAIDKRLKRRITNEIRASGGVPVADIRRAWL